MLLQPWLNKGSLSKTGAKVSWQLLSELVSCLLQLCLMADFLPEEPLQRLLIKTGGRQIKNIGRQACLSTSPPQSWASSVWKPAWVKAAPVQDALRTAAWLSEQNCTAWFLHLLQWKKAKNKCQITSNVCSLQRTNPDKSWVPYVHFWESNTQTSMNT